MIAVDTNLLVYAHRRDSEWHERALGRLTELAEGSQRWAVPWPCVHEFLAIVTHPRIYAPPSPTPTACDALAVWIRSPGCRLIGEGPGYFEMLSEICHRAHIAGPMIHDARIAAICLHHRVTELWTIDRDFSRFRGLRVVNPLG